MSKLYEYGATIIAVSRNPANLESLQKEFPKIEIRAVDMEDWKATKAAIESIGHVHFLINNAGICERQGFLDIEPESFDR